MRARKSEGVIGGNGGVVALQRGRACEGAEIMRFRRGRWQSMAGFNGAAPVRARKSARIHKEAKEGVLLQRGRACEGAEMQLLETNEETTVHASTGPRL